MQNVLSKHEMFEEIGGGETSKQGQEVESVLCQANNVGQFRQALIRKNFKLSKYEDIIYHFKACGLEIYFEYTITFAKYSNFAIL